MLKTITKKICTKCKCEKEFSCFNKATSKKDGLYPSCKECCKKHAIANREKYLLQRSEYRAKNQDKIKKDKKLFYSKNKDRIDTKNKEWAIKNKEKVKSYQQSYYSDYKKSLSIKIKTYHILHREKILLQNKIRYKLNKDEILKKQKIYNIKNKDIIKERGKTYRQTLEYKISKRTGNHIRNAKIRALSDKTISKQSLVELRNKQLNKCFYCGCELCFEEKAKVHLDHYIPLSKGGIHSIDNVVWSCSSCNLEKKAKMPTKLRLI